MADSYAVLNGKYQRALVSIRELEQERDRAERELSEKQKESALLEKNMRYLCETIEKKNQVKAPESGDSRNDKEKMWGRIPILELIKKAQSTLENYFPSREKEINQLFQFVEERGKKIRALEDQIEEMRRVHEAALKKVSQQIESGADDKQLQKAFRAAANTEAVSIDLDPSGDIQFNSESDDGLEADISEAIEVISQDGDVIKQIPKGPKVKLNSRAKKVIEEKTKKCMLDNATGVGERAGKLTEIQKYLVQAFGDTGLSEAEAITSETREKHPDIQSASRVRSAICDLLNGEDRLIESARCSAPGLPHFKVYKLSELGRDVYMYLFNKEAAEAEMDTIRKNHGTLEHGYGIRQTAMLIKQSAYVGEDDEVIYLTRAKEHTIKIDENLSYIPDIVIKQIRNGKEKLFYIEYETGKCTDVAFFEKCNKIASFSRFINIIVPNLEAKTETVAKIEKWRNKVQDGTFSLQSPVKFMLSTYSDLQDGAKGTKFPWKWEKSVSPPKK